MNLTSHDPQNSHQRGEFPVPNTEHHRSRRRMISSLREAIAATPEDLMASWREESQAWEHASWIDGDLGVIHPSGLPHRVALKV